MRDGPITLLKKLASMQADSSVRGYAILKYWHPAAGGKVEFVRTVATREEAQQICAAPEASFKEGDERNWYFLGYTPAGSRTAYVRLW